MIGNKSEQKYCTLTVCIEAMEVIEAVEVIEAAEVLRSEKSLFRTPKSFRVLNLAFF